MINTTVNCFIVEAPKENETNDCYKIKCGTKVGYNIKEKKDIINYFSASIKDANLFNKIKTLTKGSHVIFAGEFSYGIIQNDKGTFQWATLNVKSMDYDMSNNKPKKSNESKSESKKTNNPKNNFSTQEKKLSQNTEEIEDDDLPF